MVLINTNFSSLPDIKFKHLVEVQRCDCIIATARGRNGRTQVYLIFNHMGRIYRRNALRETWEELRSEAEYNHIRQLLTAAVKENVPVFRTSLKQSEFSLN